MNSGDLRCPYCGFYGEECHFPDLFYADKNNSKELNEQYRLLLDMQKAGFNIVTCGDCGCVFIQEL